jgi:hypothetical protein
MAIAPTSLNPGQFKLPQSPNAQAINGFYPGLGPAAISASHHGEADTLPRLQDAADDVGSQIGTGRVIAGMADGLDPAGARKVAFDRERTMRSRVAQRAAQMNDLAARTASAPSAAAAQTSTDLSRAAGSRGGLGAGGLLGARGALGRNAQTDLGVITAAGQRAGQEATGRLAERASYLSGGGQILGAGSGASLGMIKAGSDAERKGLKTQTDLVNRGTSLDRDLTVGKGKLLEAAGGKAIEWNKRRGMAAANLVNNASTEDAKEAKFWADMEAIRDAKAEDRKRQLWTSVPIVGSTVVNAL